MDPLEFIRKWGGGDNSKRYQDRLNPREQEALAEILDLSSSVIRSWSLPPESPRHASPRQGHLQRLAEIDRLLQIVEDASQLAKDATTADPVQRVRAILRETQNKD